jgi:hypothetical protein
VASVALDTPEEAATWIDQVGLALLFPNLDYVLPSLWEAIADDVEVRWAVRSDEGKFESFTPEMQKLWTWKDELPRRRLACVGLHLCRTSSVVAPRLVAAVYALTGRVGTPDDFRGALEELELEVAEAALELGRPTTRRELRLLVGADKRSTDRAVNALQSKLVLTNAGRADEPGWASTLHDLFTRRWRARLRHVPPRDRALQTLAESLLRTATLSAADLAAILRIRRPEARATLEALEAAGRARLGDEDGLPVWAAP